MEVIYSNAQKVSHNRSEFFIEFYQLSPEKPSIDLAEPLIRVYMNAETVMQFRNALEQNVGRFIENYLKPKKGGK